MADDIDDTVVDINKKKYTYTVDKGQIEKIGRVKGFANRIHETGLYYVSIGFAVLPLQRNGKKMDNTFTGQTYDQVATLDPDQVDKWFGEGGNYRGHNIGIAMGKDTFVIDVDWHVNKGKLDGSKTLADLEAQFGRLPSGPIQATPSEGKHYFFRHAEGCRADSDTLGASLDTKAGTADEYKGHVAAYPSKVNGGGTYEWIQGGALVDLPPWAIEKMQRTLTPSFSPPEGRDPLGNENVGTADLEQVVPLEQVERMLDVINPDDVSYEWFYKPGMAIKTQYPGEDGLAVWDQWCQRGTRYEANECIKRWAKFRADGTLRMGSLIWYAKKAGYVLQDGDIHPRDRDHIAKSMHRNVNGSLKQSEHNLGMIVTTDEFKDRFDIAYDAFHNSIIFNNRPIRDVDYVEMKGWISTMWGLEFGKERMADVSMLIAEHDQRHSFREWLEMLPEWDGKDRMQHVVGLLNDKPHRLYEVMTRKTLVAAVHRAFNPDTMVRIMPILQGDQNIKKSTFWNSLSPNGWYSDSCSFGNIGKEHGPRELIKQSSGVVFAEVPEMKGMSQSQVEEIKHFVSLTNAKLVDKYDKHSTRMARIGIFVGTVNNADILRDDTGDTRFWIIKCQTFAAGETINTDWIADNLDQIWAQAVYLDRVVKEKHWLTDPQDDIDLRELNRTHKNLFGPAEWLGEMLDEDEFEDAPLVTMENVRMLARVHNKNISAKEAHRAFAKEGWIKNTYDDGNKQSGWKFKVSKADIRKEETMVAFGKPRKLGATVKIPAGWVRPEWFEANGLVTPWVTPQGTTDENQADAARKLAGITAARAAPTGGSRDD